MRVNKTRSSQPQSFHSRRRKPKKEALNSEVFNMLIGPKNAKTPEEVSQANIDRQIRKLEKIEKKLEDLQNTLLKPKGEISGQFNTI